MEKKQLIICSVVLVICFALLGIVSLFEEDTVNEHNEIESNNQVEENIEVVKEQTTNNETENEKTELVENLTVDNCEDFANILKVDDIDPALKLFADKYKGCTFEFDGNISYMINHGDYKTRYDMLIYHGDYDKNSQKGPTFRLEDVGNRDLGIKELFLPSFVQVGSNIRATIKIEGYDEKAGLLIVDPVLIQER